MLTVRDLKFDVTKLGPMYLCDILPVHFYDENNVRSDKIIGYRYVIALKDYKFKKLHVKIEVPTKLVEVNDDDFEEVSFDNLQISTYFGRDAQIHLSAKADGISVIG